MLTYCHFLYHYRSSAVEAAAAAAVAVQRSAHPMKLPATLTIATVRCSAEAGEPAPVVGTAAAVVVEAVVAVVQHPVMSTTKIGFVDSSEVVRLRPRTDSNLQEPVLVEAAPVDAEKQLLQGQIRRESCSIASTLPEEPHLVD